VTPPALGLRPVTSGRLRLSSVLGLYRARLRGRWVQELLAIIGIATGVALLYATQVASTSLSGPVRALNHGIVGDSQLQLLSRGFTVFPESTYQQVKALPGVVRAAPVLQVPGNVVGPHGQHAINLFGADPRIVRLRGNLLRGFSSSEAAQQQTVLIPLPIAQEIGLRTGDNARLQINGRSLTLPIIVAHRDDIGDLVNTSIAIAPLAYLQRLTKVGASVTRILVQTRPGDVEQVRRQLGHDFAGRALDVRSGDYEAKLFDQAVKPTTQASTIFSAVTALIGWLFAICALLITAAERRNLATQQRDQGYPPSATLLTLLVDAVVIGVIGTAVGLAAGEILSRHGFASDVSFLSGAFPIGAFRVVTVQSVGIAVAGGMLAAAIGVLAPVGQVVVDCLPGRTRRHRSSLSPARASSVLNGRARVLVGVGCLCAAVLVTALAPGLAVLGLVSLALALVFLLPTVLAVVIAFLAWWNGRKRSAISVVFALQQLGDRRWHTRAIAITTTGAIAVFGATALQGARANLQGGLDDVVHGLDSVASVWASPKGAGGVMGTIPFAPIQASRLARSEAVGHVSLYRSGLLDIADRRAWVIAPPSDAARPLPAHQVLDGDFGEATARIRAGGWVTVSRAIAGELHLHVGDRFTVPTPEPISMRVAAITTNLGWSAGALLMNATDFARAWGSSAIASYHLRPRPGTTPAQAERHIADVLGEGSALRVETAGQRIDRQNAASRSALSRLSQIVALTLLAAVLAMGAAMTALLWQHRTLIAERKFQGLPTGLMWRSLIAETSVLFSTGAITGGVLGVLGQVLCTRGVQVVTGFPVVHHLRLDIAAACVGVVIGASLLVVLVPGFLVARAEPAWHD
jgi:putative ABC transport system permease protein